MAELRPIEPMIGSRSRVAEVLNRRRTLSIAMIRRLHAELGIPAEVLIRSPRLGWATPLDWHEIEALRR